MTTTRAGLDVLFATHGFAPECVGGTESYVADLARALASLGHRVRVVAGSPRPAPEPVAEPFEVDGIAGVRLRRASLDVDHWAKSDDPAIERLWREELRARRPDVVHLHHWIRLTRRLAVAASEEGIPVVATLHDAATTCPRAFRVRDDALCDRAVGPDSCLGCAPDLEGLPDAEAASELRSFAEDFAAELRVAEVLVVPSAAHARFLAPHLGGAAERLRVLPHGALSGGPRRRRRAARGPDAVVRLAHWGHLAPHKGAHLLFEAAAKLAPETRRRFEVLLFGAPSDAAYGARLDAAISAAGVPVRRIPAFGPADLAATPFDLAVFPSLASESHSFVLDEAFRLGVPALVSDRGAPSERLAGAGRVFRAGDADDLARVLGRLLDDGALRERLVRGSFERVKGLARNAEEMLEHYRAATAVRAEKTLSRARERERGR